MCGSERLRAALIGKAHLCPSECWERSGSLFSNDNPKRIEGAMNQESESVRNVAAQTPSKLRESCLSYSEVLAQSVSVIAPSTVPAAVLGLIYAKAGNATWLSFVLGAFGLALVTLNINQFARRCASPGSLYSYIVQGLGPTAGVLGGWSLLFAYMLTGMSTLCGFALIANVLLDQLFGIQLPILLLFFIAILTAFLIAFRDIQLSAKTMLAFEGVAILFVLALGGLIWANKGFAIDSRQFSLEGATPSGALAGVVLVVFGFSGFESSTALGAEAKNPLVTIPRSVLQSVLLAGLFFTAMAYVVVLGFDSGGASLAANEAPLSVLANSIGWGGLGTLINVGILLSFFSCTLASINSTARVLYSMAHHGLVHDALGQAHEQNRTPHIAVAVAALVTFAVPAGVYVLGANAFDCQGYFGTLCSFGFIVVYLLISLAAPVYLASIGELSRKSIAYSVGAVGFMALPVIGVIGIPGSDILPASDATGVLLAKVFAAYMAVGLGWLFVQRVRQPKMVARMQSRSDVDIYLSGSFDSKVSS
jgi:amino acid transporter